MEASVEESCGCSFIGNDHCVVGHLHVATVFVADFKCLFDVDHAAVAANSGKKARSRARETIEVSLKFNRSLGVVLSIAIESNINFVKEAAFDMTVVLNGQRSGLETIHVEINRE